MQRRDFISNSLLSLPVIAGSFPSGQTGFRVLFVTDMHLSPSIPQAVKAAAFLREYIQKNKIDFVVNGGDTVYDVSKLTQEGGKEMWDMSAAFFEGLNKPVYHCIGNHDVYEWELKEEITDPAKSKETVVKRLQMPGRFYTFTKGDWKFIVLDSILYRPRGYCGGLDEEQFAWLEKELSASKEKHTCLISHIPIITACSALYLPWEKHAVFPKIAERLAHHDAPRIFELAENHNVRLYLHGHLHMQEAIQYKHASIHTLPAFCADMWRGDFHGFKAGFTLLDFAGNGSVTSTQIDLPL